jgi:hypothetical protein
VKNAPSVPNKTEVSEGLDYTSHTEKDGGMLCGIWTELDPLCDICRVVEGTHMQIENVSTGLLKKKYTILKNYFTKLLTLNTCPVYGWKRNLSKF